jgi:hypothetical protein
MSCYLPPKPRPSVWAVIGGSFEHSPVVHELVAKFADIWPPRKRRRSTGGSSKRQQHTKSTAYASGWPQGHGATSTETKSRACPTRAPARTEYARTLRHLQAPDAQRIPEHSRTPLGRREWAAQQGGTGPVLAASPRPCSPGCGRAAGTPQRERFAHGEAGQRPHIDSTD